MTRIFKPEELTDWFPPDTRPVHIGPYRIRHRRLGICLWRWWDGKRWLPGRLADRCPSAVQLQRLRGLPSGKVVQDVWWQGVCDRAHT